MARKKQDMVTSVFRNPLDAQSAHDRVSMLGYTRDEVNVLMADSTRAKYFPHREESAEKTGNQGLEGTAVGGAVGTAVGATLAAVAAIGSSIMIPGLGLIIAGPITALLAGAGAGALAGGLVGGLIGLGIPESNAKAYEQALREGGVVLGVHPHSTDDAAKIKRIFEDHHGENVITYSC